MKVTGVLFKTLRGNMQTSKRGNKNYYKGTGGGRQGHWTTRGFFLLDKSLLREFIVPDLSNFDLKPYVSYKAQTDSPSHDFRDYFTMDNLPASIKSDTEFVEQLQTAAEEAYQSFVAPRRFGAKQKVQSIEAKLAWSQQQLFKSSS